MKWKRLLPAAAFAGAMSLSLSASTLGSFNLGGDIFVNGTASITWTDNNNVANMAVISQASGIYAGLNGQEVTIETLNSSTEPATSTSPGFADQLFIVFPTAANLNPLDINTIFAGVDVPGQCTAPPSSGPPAQVCTPTFTNGVLSPFNFENNPPPNNITSTASFAFSGDVANAKNESFYANFTSQFTVPFQTVLAELGPNQNGTVSDSYSATFTVINAPETSTLSLLGLGLGLVLLSRSGLMARRRRQG